MVHTTYPIAHGLSREVPEEMPAKMAAILSIFEDIVANELDDARLMAIISKFDGQLDGKGKSLANMVRVLVHDWVRQLD